jgi:RimJ/RimL family protein N-acetyltransferase
VSDGEVRVRPRTEADIPAIVDACRDPEIARWTRVPENYTEADARSWYDEASRDQADGTGLALLVVDAGDDRLLGSIGLHEPHYEERRCEIGYWLARKARGRGYMARAVRLFCAWIFDSLAMDRVTIISQPGNRASQRVAENAGFTHEGTLRSYVVHKGERMDMESYSLLRGELR